MRQVGNLCLILFVLFYSRLLNIVILTNYDFYNSFPLYILILIKFESYTSILFDFSLSMD
jgi:hypothetical protein